ncbi:demethylmenaquinone methyltransferase [Paraliobacillus quinghaiensis]|uniref:Demethylmenaquinone methyltransferase n=1 Tax=Paraliobacillus quinghaiensis TaxID=470815 RepID=A0A917WRI7_9BACI|nr:demethylmenaquinone methyltransferase [Paraliobacillus quinghaiensis]GGM22840.1 demethylmenaquinone methyltransferase [Paraliobacillus quinghaiensis]
MRDKSKEERVHNVFENIYKRYDFMNSVISFKRHKAWRKDVMKRMNVRPGDQALDVCCGTGDWSFSLANQIGENGKVIGLDFSKNMLSVANEKLEQSKHPQLKFIYGNAMELPFESDTFDFVTIGFGLRNVPDYKKVLEEMTRVVKPGGMVVCLETSQPTMLGFRQLYYLYFRYIMPLVGRLIAKSYKEYAWLHESAKTFPAKNELKDLFQEVGLESVQVKGYTGGVAAMHLGKKPSVN